MTKPNTAPKLPLKLPATSLRPPVVLQVLPRLKEGGVEESALALQKYLKRNQKGLGWRGQVVAAPGPRSGEFARLGWPVHALPMASKNPLRWLWTARALVRLIEHEGITLVHARSRACAWPARWAAWWCGIPFLTTFHGIYSTSGGWLKRFYNSVMLAGPVTIANSEFTSRHIQATYGYPAEKIVVAPRGIDPRFFDPAKVTPAQRQKLRRALEVPAGVPLLIMVGRLTSWKGQHLLLEALSLLPHRNFVVAFAGGEEGRGSYAADLRGFARRLGIEAQVRWLGSRRDVPELLAASSLAFSCSTRPEAFGRVAIEAMVMGVPVVASALGGSTETIRHGKTGWLVPVKDDGSGEVAPQALRDVVAEALQNPQRLRRMGQEARAHVLAHYTVDRMCKAELEAYERAVPAQGAQS